jgi:plastocyanin
MTPAAAGSFPLCREGIVVGRRQAGNHPFAWQEDVMHKLSRIAAIAALGIGLAIAGCGDDDDQGSATTATAPAARPASGGESLELTADPGGALKFDKKTLAADAGTVEIVMDNPSQVPHNVAIEGDGVDEHGPVVERDKTSTVAADLEAGTYEFYCSVGEHRQAGMEGTLTVR